MVPYTHIPIYIYTYIHIYRYTYIHIYIYTYIHIYIYTNQHQFLPNNYVTRSTAPRWQCVFVIHGMLSMILDVVVRVGFSCFYFVRKGRQRPIFRQQNDTNYFADTKTAFLWILHSPQLIGFHNRLVFTAAFQVLPRTF